MRERSEEKPDSLVTPATAGLLPRERNLNMLQRVTLNVIQVFQRIFDAINPCIIIYEYINTFSFLFFTLYFYCSLWWSDDCLQEMLCRIQKIFLFLLDKLQIPVLFRVYLYMHVFCL